MNMLEDMGKSRERRPGYVTDGHIAILALPTRAEGRGPLAHLGMNGEAGRLHG